MIEMIDRGGFGSIYSATDMQDNCSVIVKIVSKFTNLDLEWKQNCQQPRRKTALPAPRDTSERLP